MDSEAICAVLSKKILYLVEVIMIPFVDLQSQYRRIQPELEAGVLGVLRGGQFILGREVRILEEKLEEFAQVKHAVTCASGTDALMIALMAKDIGPGDVIFTTPFTFFATAEVIALLGATPIFVDIDPVTFNMCPEALEHTIQMLERTEFSGAGLPKLSRLETLRLKGIIAVDLFGIPADYNEINAIADRHGLFVIEDAAQSFGGEYFGKHVGSLAEIACTSFFPAKPLGCYGDGGAIFTNDDMLADLFRSIRVHGQGIDRYENVRLGITGRLDTIQAAILLSKLTIFESEVADRRRVAQAYSNAIASYSLPLIAPSVPDGYRSAWAQYSLLAKDGAHRQELMDRLKAASVPTAIYYPKPLHLQKAFSSLGYTVGDFPVSEDVASRIFSVPMHPYLDNETINNLVKAMI